MIYIVTYRDLLSKISSVVDLDCCAVTSLSAVTYTTEHCSTLSVLGQLFNTVLCIHVIEMHWYTLKLIRLYLFNYWSNILKF